MKEGSKRRVYFVRIESFAEVNASGSGFSCDNANRSELVLKGQV